MTRGGHQRRTAPPGPLDHDDLTLLALVAQGLTVEAVGRRMLLSERTVRRRLRTVCSALDVSTPIEAVVWAVRRDLI
ncbi:MULTISPECIES: LuxR C-terminal-related transcriptional regulator [Mumia]|uniref:LuxR C-terminal-related transcriptional regulator n=1 Tax=Mumia TaxID=1546255 RepID=UPI00141EA2D0|nr:MULTISPECIES: LuxR C-terminal-related transcriptional regulator [unclassified Mumia]QMW66317.1 LuxR family transcriptional regulator [Mumia sp. ZJ1417]